MLESKQLMLTGKLSLINTFVVGQMINTFVVGQIQILMHDGEAGVH